MSNSPDQEWKRLKFGEFLVAHNRVKPIDVVNALALQLRRHVRLGELAREKQLLTDEQIDKIVEVQKRTELKFGEAAVQIGLLDEAQVDDLLVEQKARHMMLGEILVEQEKLDSDVLEASLDDYFETLAHEVDLTALDHVFTPE